jgi:hypothetical protein
MNNVTFTEMQTPTGTQTNALIDHGDGSFTSMLKSTYDEMIAQQELNKPNF